MGLWQWFLVVGGSAMGLYALLPAGGVGEVVTELALHMLLVPAILLGVRRHRPAPATGWYVIAGAQVIYAAGNITASLATLGSDGLRVYPASADLLFLAAYAGLATGLAMLLARRSRGQGLGILIDTLTVTVGLSSLLWVFFLEPSATDPGTSLAAAATTVAYALFDVAVVAILINLGLSPGARKGAFWLLGAALSFQLAGDFAASAGSFAGTFTLGDPSYLFWMGFYTALGACALHPRMRDLTEPGERGQELSARGRTIVLALAAVVPPAAILFESTADSVQGLAWITIATFATVMWRLVRTSRDLERYESADRLRGEFVSMVSHELRTPLTVIKGVLASLERGVGGPLPPAAGQLVALATSNGERLHRLVDDLLDVQRSALGAPPSVMDAVDLDELFARVTDDLRGRAAATGVRLRTDHVGAAVRGDDHRLQQVLANLLDNALKYSPADGTIRLSGERRRSDVLVRVRDDGRGIPSHMHERIFDPFQQVDASDARERNGTGLGLAICRSIVEQHGGRIWVESVLGHGSTFLVSLPLAGEPELLRGPAEHAVVAG